jgi:hypothetical protein
MEQRFSTEEAERSIFCNTQWRLWSALIYVSHDPGIASYSFVIYGIMSQPLCTLPNRLLDVPFTKAPRRLIDCLRTPSAHPCRPVGYGICPILTTRSRTKINQEMIRGIIIRLGI